MSKKTNEDYVGYIFVHSILDELGLDPYEFRVLAHIARRTGSKTAGRAFASNSKMSEVCGMGKRKVQYALKVLQEIRLIKRVATEDSRRTNTWQLCLLDTPLTKEDVVAARAKVKGEPEYLFHPEMEIVS